MKNEKTRRVLLRFSIFALLILMGIEVAWLIQPRNLLADRYRHSERQRAFKEWATQQSPESKAVWGRERQLLHEHQSLVAGFVMAALILEAAAAAILVGCSPSSREKEESRGKDEEE